MSVVSPADLMANDVIGFKKGKCEPHFLWKFLDAGIQDVSTSISIVHDLIELSSSDDDDDGDESDKHI